MTRAEFWARKLVQAESLGINIDDMLNAMVVECVSAGNVDGCSTTNFADGSILRVRPIMTQNGRMGQVEWIA